MNLADGRNEAALAARIKHSNLSWDSSQATRNGGALCLKCFWKWAFWNVVVILTGETKRCRTIKFRACPRFRTAPSLSFPYRHIRLPSLLLASPS